MKVYTDDFGFKCFELNTQDGGHIKIADYQKEPGESDIGLFSLMNENGLGYSKYIRNVESLSEFEKTIDNITWIHEAEKLFLKVGLEEIRKHRN